MNKDQYIKYSENWVAIDEKTMEILFASKSLKELNELITKKKISNVYIHYLSDVNKALTPVCLR